MQPAAIRKAVRLPPWCLLAAVGIITSGRRACAQEARKRTSATEQPSAIAPISIGRTSLVSPDRPEDPFFETALAADPADPQHLIGAAIEFGRDGSSGTAVYVSWDGGSTWTRSRRVGTDSTMFSGLDPVVLFGPDGIPYYVHSHDRVYVHQSLDGGRTWQPATVVPGGSYDREFLAVDRTGRHRGRMYLAGLLDLDRLDGSRVGTIGFSTSADSGKTFTEPRRLTEDEGAWMMAMDLAVTPDGTILVPYKTGRVNAKGETDSVSLRMARSTDGGLSFTRSSEIGSVVWPTSLRGRAQSVSPLVPIAIDRTHGPYDGRIYLAWADYGSAGDGSAFRIRVASSADTGLSWSIATVSDDAVLADRTTAAIAVDSTGMVGVTWYDRGDDVADNCQRLYFAVSSDGGATFTRKAVAAPAQRLCPAAPANWIPRGYAFLNTDRPLSPDGKPVDAVGLFSPTARFRDGGDTQGLVAGQAGVFHAL